MPAALNTKAKSRRGDWGDDYIEPMCVPGPDESHFFMGAQVGWSAAREQPADDDSGRCPLCRSTDELDDSGEIREGALDVCAKCQRWGRDPVLARVMLADAINRGTIEPVLAIAPPDWTPQQEAAARAEARSRPPMTLRRGPDGEMRPAP